MESGGATNMSDRLAFARAVDAIPDDFAWMQQREVIDWNAKNVCRRSIAIEVIRGRYRKFKEFEELVRREKR